MERDYLLSWILAAISDVDVLQKSLVFKGGTALKKCYFGDYRFSEDLDFSAVKGVPTGKAMEAAIQEVCAKATQRMDPFVPVELVWKRHVERDPHPGGQEGFDIQAKFPWHRQPQTTVMVEVAIDEPLIKSPVKRSILHEYGEPLQGKIAVYSLEEIVLEKLRAILQHLRLLERRGWVRSRARDYYDLWRILSAYRNKMDVEHFERDLHKKCAIRKVDFADAESFFPPPLLVVVEKTWDQWLGPLVPDLPTYSRVVGELRPLIVDLLS